MPAFTEDVEQIRKRAMHKIEDGAVTQAYKGDVKRTIEILNEALATEIVCVLRYMHHYFMATGVHGKGVADEFKEHADAEREHADRIAERIQQLGGKPDFNPKSLLERSASQYVEGETLADMIREDLIAERVVIEVYTDMVRYFGDKDPTTRRIIEEILADEEEHASDLADLLYVVDPQTGKDKGQDPGTDPLNIGRRQNSKQNEGEESMAKNQKEQARQSGNQRGLNNREAAEDLQRGGLKQAERGNRSLSGRSRGDEPQGDVQGHPKRKGIPEPEDVDADEIGAIRPGEAAGRNRSAHVTNPNK